VSAEARGAAAITAARAGLRVFPLVPRAKKPLRTGWQRSATRDAGVVAAVWRDVPDANIGVLCGSGLVVVDTDSAEADARVRELGMPDTPTVRTADGRHYYLAGESRNRNDLLPDVDIRGTGGYVVGAGSVHPSGVEYRWLIPPWEVSTAAVPPGLLAVITASWESPKSQPDYRARVIQNGTRNATLFRLGCSLRGRYGLSYEEVLATLIEANRSRCRPPLESSEVERVAASAASYDTPPSWATDPLAFALDPFLGARERILLMAMARYANDEGVAWPGVRRLHADTGLATDTIKLATDALVAAGRLIVERRRGTSNLYRLLTSPERSLGSTGTNKSGSSVLPSRTVAGASP
jgi:hypothetical protein